MILVSIVTFFLQAISFATTWSGSKVYLEGVFPYAALLFALAIQATAYFISNSLRTRITPLRVIAMVVALCCSTYYSYIGIYNSVNSPTSYLQENYMRISDELTRIHDTTLENSLSEVRLCIGDTYAKIHAEYRALMDTQANIDACLEELADIDTNYSGGLRAPKQSSYETYEEYAAAYQAYIEAKSAGSKTEKELARAGILSSYGFEDVAALNQAKIEVAADITAMYAALGVSQESEVDLQTYLSTLYLELSSAVDAVALGQPMGEDSLKKLTSLLQATISYGDTEYDLASITNALSLSSKSAKLTAIADYQTLVDALPEKMVTTGNLMTLKSNMDSQIVTAIISLNSVLSEDQQLNPSESRFQIMDLYLIPVQALIGEDTKTTAFFCLGVAGLIDGLSVLFAVAIRKKKPVWKRHFLISTNPEDYLPQICATLPTWNGNGDLSTQSLAEFLAWFGPSPETEQDGYMMQASMQNLEGFYPLVALLCQINLAKVIPAGLFENETETVLLRAKFVFWANTLIYEENIERERACFGIETGDEIISATQVDVESQEVIA